MFDFNACTTLDDLKKAYRKAAMENHPDVGGDVETMKAINSAYAARFEELKARHNATADEFHQTSETPDEFRDIIAALLKIPGLHIELCGSWLWISGDTRANKDVLKATGCRYSGNKKMWYWRHEEEGRHWHKRDYTMRDIRARYGSETITTARARLETA